MGLKIIGVCDSGPEIKKADETLKYFICLFRKFDFNTCTLIIKKTTAIELE